MADDDALRARRSRAHRSGDHRLCRPRTCRALRSAPNDLSTLEDTPSSLSAAVESYAEALDPPEGDVRRVMLAAAVILARAVDEGDGPRVSGLRELRHVLRDIADTDPPGDGLDQIRARRWAHITDLVNDTGRNHT